MDIIKRFFNKKIIVFAAILVILILVFSWLKSNKKFVLQINTTPSEDISVYVNNNITKNPQKIELKAGEYNLRIYKDGYFEEKQTITLNKNLSLSYTLIPKSSLKPTNPVSIKGQDSIFSSDKYLISKNIDKSSINVLTPNLSTSLTVRLPNNLNVLNFTAFEDKIIIISEDSSLNNKYFIYDITTKSISELNLENFEPLVSVSVVDTKGNLLITGKYDIKYNSSTLYLYNYTNNSSEELLKNNNSYSIYSLGKNKILLVSNLDAVDKDSMSIMDITTKKYSSIFSSNEKVNDVVTNTQNNQFIYKSMTGINVYDYKNLNNKRVLNSNSADYLYFWIDSNNIAVINMLKNTISKLNINTLEQSEELDLPQIPGKKLISISTLENKAYYNYMDFETKEIIVLTSTL